MHKLTRTEHDSLGVVKVPEDALFGSQTQRAISNFNISGLRPWRAFIWSMAVIKRAAAEVNQELGLLDSEIAAAIISAAQEVVDGKWDEQFLVDPFQAGAGTSHNMNLKLPSPKGRGFLEKSPSNKRTTVCGLFQRLYSAPRGGDT